MQVCTSLQTDNHASTPPLCFLQAGCPSCRPTNSVKALKAQHSWYHCIPKPHHLLPHLNPDWFYFSGTGLCRLFWKRGHKTGVVVVVVVVATNTDSGCSYRMINVKWRDKWHKDYISTHQSYTSAYCTTTFPRSTDWRSIIRLKLFRVTELVYVTQKMFLITDWVKMKICQHLH